VKAAPYSREIHPIGEIRIYIGTDAWNAARIRNAYSADALVFPDGESPTAYRWPVHGLDVLIIQAGTINLKPIPELAHVLIAAGANIVRVVYGAEMAIYRSTRRAAA